MSTGSNSLLWKISSDSRSLGIPFNQISIFLGRSSMTNYESLERYFPSSLRQFPTYAFLFIAGLPTTANSAERPNVIVIMSDDQGVGDYGFLGNKVIRTPALDEMHARSGYLSNFYVSPVCAPTRASLMTGRYNYRTRCIDTYLGRAMMDTSEVTLAEFLGNAGYRTGIYGKWHLGDCYPMRPMDQGFQDSLIHRGGGIGQRSDPIGAEGKYTDPVLFRNGVETPMTGYCTDIYFNAAMEFISESVQAGDQFFTYIATNTPHSPFHDVPMELYEGYQEVNFESILVDGHHPKRSDQEIDTLARIAAMITNIDDNVGRLFDTLDDLGIRENTIVVYLNDNGPNTWRYVGNMRGKKGGVDDGGIRSPLLFHWPAAVTAQKTSSEVSAHIDLLPTILDACEITIPDDHHLDGRSFLPLLTSDNAVWPTRPLVIQAHRGIRPQRYHHFALHQGPWKLVHPTGFSRERFRGEPKLELYDLSQDPMQLNDLAASHPETLTRLKAIYNDWFDDVSSTRPNNYAPPRIIIGSKHDLRTVLTRQDWRPASGQASPKDPSGHWFLKAAVASQYEIELILANPLPSAAEATVTIGSKTRQLEIPARKQRGHNLSVSIPEGEFQLAADVTIDGDTDAVHQVVVSRK